MYKHKSRSHPAERAVMPAVRQRGGEQLGLPAMPAAARAAEQGRGRSRDGEASPGS